jgi:hypothetical protein
MSTAALRLEEPSSVRPASRRTSSRVPRRDLQRDPTGFEDVEAFYKSQYNVTGATPENVPCTINTASMFQLLGSRTLYGDTWLCG